MKFESNKPLSCLITILFICSILTGCDNVNNNSDSLDHQIITQDRNVLYIGNSYTKGIGSSSGTDGLFAKTKQYYNRAIAFTGSGTGFNPWNRPKNSQLAPNPATFSELIIQASNDPNINNSDITDIVIISAMGDTRAHTQGSMFENIEQTIKLIHDLFPQARVYLYYAEIIANPDAQSMFSNNYIDHQYETDRLFREYSTKLNFCYLGWGGKLFNLKPELLSTDGYHPNDQGYNLLALDLLFRLSAVDYNNTKQLHCEAAL